MICLREVIVYISYKVMHKSNRCRRNNWQNLIRSFLCELLSLMQKVGQRIDKQRQAKQVYTHNVVTCNMLTRPDLRSLKLIKQKPDLGAFQIRPNPCPKSCRQSSFKRSSMCNAIRQKHEPDFSKLIDRR